MFNTKIFNLSILSWTMIIVVVVLFFFMNNDEEKFSEEKKEESKIDQNEKDNMIKVYNFNTLWCGYSRQFQPNWDKFADMNDDSDVEIVDVKCDNETNKELCGKYSIPGFPTVLFVKGDKIAEYSGDRSVEDLESALENFKN